ncbi:MAG: hypothetical protein HY865_22300 [Chloroflexi bacterium]|nr:hypothetical protein [Chloroflexota bacterium]
MMDEIAKSPMATPSLGGVPLREMPSPVVVSTPTVDELGTAYAVIAIDKATSTAEAASTGTAYSITDIAKVELTQGFIAGIALTADKKKEIEDDLLKTQTAGTSNANFQTGVPLTGTVIGATQIVEADELNSTRAAIWIKNVGGTLVLFSFFGVLVFGLYKFILFGEEHGKASVLKQKTDALKPDEKTGKFPLVLANALDGNIVNPNLQVKPVLDPQRTDDGFTNEQALANAAHARETETVRAIAPALAAVLGNPLAKRSSGNGDGASTMQDANIKISKPEPPATMGPYLVTPPKFQLPDWSMLNSWDPQDGVPYYTENGLRMIDTDLHSHIGVIGKTGWGKSRRFIRPMIAFLLARGERVVSVGKSADYWTFESHPNFSLFKVSKITEPDQAKKYAETLGAFVSEMNRRDDVLTATRSSTWARSGRKETFLILDELGNVLSLLKGDLKTQSVIWITALCKEGRKAGFHVVVANQRATGMADILSQTGKAVFYVEPEEESRHYFLRGASELDPGYFLARFGKDHIAGAFDPSDKELMKFMDEHPVVKLEGETWIEAMQKAQAQVVVDQKEDDGLSLPLTYSDPHDPEKKIGADLKAAYAAADEEIRIEDKIAEVWLSMRDSHKWEGWNSIERSVYGEVKNGARAVKVKKTVATIQGVEVDEIGAEIERLLASWGTTRSTTTTTTPKNDDFQPVFVA